MVVLEALVVGAVTALVVRHFTHDGPDDRGDGFSLLKFWFFWPLQLVELAGKALVWFVRGSMRLVRRWRSDSETE